MVGSDEAEKEEEEELCPALGLEGVGALRGCSLGVTSGEGEILAYLSVVLGGTIFAFVKGKVRKGSHSRSKIGARRERGLEGMETFGSSR